MYKVLVIRDNIEVVKMEKENINYVQVENLDITLRQQEYDIIYLKRNLLLNDRLKNVIFSEYIILPQILEKFSLNSYITFVNLQMINKIIMDNISIFNFKNYYDEIVIANVVKEKIIKPRNINEIYMELYLNKKERIEVKKAIDRVVSKSYAVGNFFRKLKYVLKKNKIQEIFFYKIIENMKNDVKNMQSLNDTIEVIGN